MVVFFFFQAEDGIRDYKVTGVQTCALPISATSATFNVSTTTIPSAQTATVTATLNGVSKTATLSLSGGGGSATPLTGTSKIGRASCRERVEISVVAVSLKKKKYERNVENDT